MTPFIAMLLEPCSILVIHRAESYTRTVHSGKRLAVYAIWLGPGADVTLGLRLRRIAPGTRESLGHRCWQLRHAHMCISGPVNSWPDIVQLTIGWTLWLRHFWQVTKEEKLWRLPFADAQTSRSRRWRRRSCWCEDCEVARARLMIAPSIGRNEVVLDLCRGSDIQTPLILSHRREKRRSNLWRAR